MPGKSTTDALFALRVLMEKYREGQFHCPLFFTRNNDLECKSSRFAAVDRRSVADKQLNWNSIIHSASVAQCQELGAKT